MERSSNPKCGGRERRSRAHCHGAQSGGRVRQRTNECVQLQMVINSTKKAKEKRRQGGRANTLVRIVRKSLSRQVTVEQRRGGGRGRGSREDFWRKRAEGAASAKALGWDYACSRPLWLEQSELV